jgi:mannose-6-phosphate isomerase-like protein (cupin superfamily)
MSSVLQLRVSADERYPGLRQTVSQTASDIAATIHTTEEAQAMATRGQTLHNRVTGEFITFLSTTEDTDGEYLEFVCRVGTDGVPIPPHVHETQEERFEVMSGTLGVMLGGKKYELRAGDKAILPVRVRHQWWNAGEDDVVFRVEAQPARNLEALLEANAGLAESGKLNKKGMPRNPFYLVNIGRLAEVYMPFIPMSLQKLMGATGSAIGRAFGVDPSFAYYRSVGQATAVENANEVAA